ncbi:MAG: DUF1295 domain-containing protein [Calditrichaeota bacterium]|nr:MAG: DUF1295 domain-containing protein [Calditrichota bacterium]
MALYEEWVAQGHRLFRWRGQLPFVLAPLFLLALRETVQAGRFPGPVYQGFCLSVAFLGLVVRALTVGFVPPGTSGRNTRSQVAETLNTTGMYSLCRHPLYLGNFLVLLGMALFTARWWAVVISALAFWLYYERIMLAEEDFLRKKFGEAFTAWARRTPAFWPRWRNWRPPSRAFSLRKLLRREYTGLLVYVGSFTVLKLMANAFATGRLGLSLPWRIFLIAGLGIYLALRTVSKKTDLLHG